MGGNSKYTNSYFVACFISSFDVFIHYLAGQILILTQFIGKSFETSSVSPIWWKFHFDISVAGRQTLDWKQERPHFCSWELVVLPQIQSSDSMLNSFEANARALPKKQILQYLSGIRFTSEIWIAQIYHWYQSHLLWNPDHSLRVRKSKNFPDSKIHEKKLFG